MKSRPTTAKLSLSLTLVLLCSLSLLLTSPTPVNDDADTRAADGQTHAGSTATTASPATPLTQAKA
ncbi:MAG TPA: hypothetical protein VD835_13065, partial [Pyrinomonadaceae bacterium]|nr:hypothetical protein [Pyrinomonadaceae bacterium]